MKIITTFDVSITLDTFRNTGDKINTISLCSRRTEVSQNPGLSQRHVDPQNKYSFDVNHDCLWSTEGPHFIGKSLGSFANRVSSSTLYVGRPSYWTLCFSRYNLFVYPESTTAGKSWLPPYTNVLRPVPSNQNYINCILLASIMTNQNCSICIKLGDWSETFSIKDGLPFVSVEHSLLRYLNLCLAGCSSFCSNKCFLLFITF